MVDQPGYLLGIYTLDEITRAFDHDETMPTPIDNENRAFMFGYPSEWSAQVARSWNVATTDD
jgi:hypothetical protein